ncbi:MAG: two-component system nitrogen regulation sensor histidine kinase NtrY [Saprospiraceae bacterium]|jgi:two-component system nitrogen regulation sensor histidine kinase NtrY
MSNILKTFRTRVLLQLGIIILLLMGITYVFLQKEKLYVLIVLIPLLIALLWRLFYMINKTNRELSQFLLSIRYNDFEQEFALEKSGASQRELHSAFNQITDKFRDLRTEKEVQSQLMQTILGNVDTGIFCTDKEGKGLMTNTALKQLLHRSYIPNFDTFEAFAPNLYEALKTIKPSERKIIKESIQNEILQIAIQVYILKVKEEEIKVYTFYNIHNELSDQEVKSWQKLIRILAHEIMNSIAPIASLSSSALQLIPDSQNIASEEVEQVKEALQIIHKRSEGLMSFTDTYRKLTRIPPPQLKAIQLNSFFTTIHKLFEQDLKQKGIRWTIKFLFHEIKLMADPILLEQVFINILKNTIEALEGISDPEISILVDKTPQGKVNIQVIDNGQGIPEDVVDQIFIPFFTTKKNGSGIGMSLSQQIIRLHGGSINLQSKEGVGTMVSVSV